MKKALYTPLFIFFLLFTHCCFSQVDVVYSDLVWSDEFNTNGAVDNTNWYHETLYPAGGTSWFNGEVQAYTNSITNSFVSNGMLNIVAKKQNFTDQGVTKNYTSARLNSKFAYKYGRVDVRAKLPIDTGTWPAIWLLGKDVTEIGTYFYPTFGTTDWPACGEIDIMEHGIFSGHPVNYVQSTLHTPSSNGNSVNYGGIIASDLQNNFHIYSMNWSPNQISFLLDGVIYYTYNPAVKNASTWPFDQPQFLLLNIAMGGVSGNIASNFNQATMQIDYVRVYQNTSPDTLPPTNFTASVTGITGNSVNLSLNANDNSGSVVYTITYGSTTLTYSGASGALQSIVIPNLLPNTTYTFTVSATDAAGNVSVSNTQVLTATTSAASSNSCSGTDTQAQQGTFSTGYNYTFQTVGTNVNITFDLLDTNHVGVVAFLWEQTPFTETQMTNVSGTTFTQTITGQTVGATITYAVKFAYSGGYSVTKYFQYVVGSNCALETENESQLADFSFKNPAHDVLYIQSKTTIDKVEIYNMLGALVQSTNENTNEVNIKNLSKGFYLLTVYSGTQKSVKKLIVE